MNGVDGVCCGCVWIGVMVGLWVVWVVVVVQGVL